MTEPYAPSNGCEGADFCERFCFRCVHDAEFERAMAAGEESDKGCPILAASFVFSIGEPGYPKEWIQDEDGPRCTVFLLDKSEGVPYRCDKTQDMFSK